MNVRRMPLGLDATGKPRVGSLELLDHKRGSPRLDLDMEWTSAIHVDTGDTEEIMPCSQELVIMNPPYTRGDLRHDQYPRKVEKKLKGRESELFKDRAGHGTSAGTMFMDLGEHLCSLEEGSTLATVVPLVMAGAPSAVDARKLLAEWFHVEYVIASHDPGRVAFSENTNISEMLVICRRHPQHPKARPDTKFVILRTNSPSAVDALSVVTAIENGSLPATIGRIETWPADKMAQGLWRPLTLTSPELVRTFVQLCDGQLFESCQYSELASIGPSGGIVRKLFDKHEYTDRSTRKALWHNDTEATQTLLTRADVDIHQKRGATDAQADSCWARRQRLLHCVKPRLNTARVNAVWMQDAALGSMWLPARVRDLNGAALVAAEKSMCAYFNSSLGWVAMMGCASPTVLSRLDVSLDALRRTPIPKLSSSQSAQLAAVFDQVCNVALSPLIGHSDETRIQLDNAVADCLGVDREVVDTIRRELSVEPSVQRADAK